MNATTFQTDIRRPGVIAGIVLSLAGTGIYALGLTLLSFDDDTYFRVVLLNLVLAFLYSVYWVLQCFRRKESGRTYLPFVYALWLISCFSCNLLINVFENLPLWVHLLTALFCISAWVLYWDLPSAILRNIAGFVNGISTLLIVYYAVYLLPVLPYSLLGILAFGLGFHGLVPGIILLLHGFSLFTLCADKGRRIAPWLGGLFVGLLLPVFLTLALHREVLAIRAFVQHSHFADQQGLPQWVLVSQRLKPNLLNEILMKEELVYTGADRFLSWKGHRFLEGGISYNDRKVHDPLLNVAFIALDNPVPLAEDRIHILESVFGNRLQTERRLWSETDIYTTLLSEDVQLYPSARLAYTELNIELSSRQRWDGEAIYSFLLPEGSVASSLSLCFNGVERKGVLASKTKAQQAYNQVVGVEMRDPALLQWREGNRIVVRIFPVRNNLPRHFKIGITTPLQLNAGKAVYRSIQVQGPGMQRMQVLSRVRVQGRDVPEFSDTDFEKEGAGFFRNSRGIDPWQLSLAAAPPQPQYFAWEGKKYLLQESLQQQQPADYDAVVLDLNASWEKEDARRWVQELKGIPLFVLTADGKHKLDADNFEEYWNQAVSFSYTLPPLYLLRHSDLLITSSGSFSPDFDGLAGTPFLKKIHAGLKQKELRVLNVGKALSPFWQTLREQRYVQMMNTGMSEALQMASARSYPVYTDTTDAVHIQDSGISLSLAGPDVKAPESDNDHIYRLYAYGYVLQQHLAAEDDTSRQNMAYVSLAEDAHIVSPVSSMLVLETDADYDRTGIEANKNTLGNASMKNDGAVPEPHEWALIALAVACMFYLFKKKKDYAL